MPAQKYIYILFPAVYRRKISPFFHHAGICYNPGSSMPMWRPTASIRSWRSWRANSLHFTGPLGSKKVKWNLLHIKENNGCILVCREKGELVKEGGKERLTICVSACVYVYAYLHTHMCVYIYIPTQIHTHVCVHICMRIMEIS